MYKEIVGDFLVKVIQGTGAKPDPLTSTLIKLIYMNATEKQCQDTYEFTRDFVFNIESRIHTMTEKPVNKLELKL